MCIAILVLLLTWHSFPIRRWLVEGCWGVSWTRRSSKWRRWERNFVLWLQEWNPDPSKWKLKAAQKVGIGGQDFFKDFEVDSPEPSGPNKGTHWQFSIFLTALRKAYSWYPWDQFLVFVLFCIFLFFFVTFLLYFLLSWFPSRRWFRLRSDTLVASFLW